MDILINGPDPEHWQLQPNDVLLMTDIQKKSAPADGSLT